MDALNEKLAASGGDVEAHVSDEAKEQHTKQVAALRDEIAQKSKRIEELTVSSLHRSTSTCCTVSRITFCLITCEVN